MRIVSYNILEGGGSRADAITQVIEAQRPDVVGLVEADDVSVVEKIASRLGMDFIHAPGNSRASALLSRWPIRETINLAPARPALHKSLLEATVIGPGETEWVFGVLHLHAHAREEDERTREQEIADVLEVFEPYRKANRPHLLMGDFNSNAPYQQIDPARCKPSTRAEWSANGGHIPRRVVQAILDSGYLDSLRVVNPSAAENIGTFSTQHPGQRVDYVFTFGFDRTRLRQAWVTEGPLAKDASDHFAVGLEIA